MNVQKPFGPYQADTPGIDRSEHQDHFGEVPTLSMNLVVLMRILRIRREVILGTAATVIVLTLIVLYALTPLYAASSVVMLNQQKNNVEDVASVLSGMPTDQASVQNQVQILTSRDLAGRVVEKLNLEDDSDYRQTGSSLTQFFTFLNPMSWLGGKKTLNDARGIDERRNELIDHLEGNLTVAPIGLSTAIRVTYEATNAEDATRIDNAIADAYVEDQLDAKFDATKKATRWLSDRIQELSRQSQAADAAVQEYRAANGLSETANGGSVTDQQMSAISAQLVVANSDLAEKRATYEHVQELVKEGRSADVSQAVSSPLIGTLRGQEADLIRQEADLSSKYGPRNPKMLDLESQKANLESKINEEVGRIVQSVANDVSIAEVHVSSLQASLNRIEQQSSQQNQLKVKLSSLLSAASSAKAMYEAFLSKLNQTTDQQGIETPDARIISRAKVPQAAAYPNKMLVISIAVPAGFLLGLMFAFMLERLDSGFRTTRQIEDMLGLPVLTTIPEIFDANSSNTKNNEEGPADSIIKRPMSSYSEAIRGLELALTLSNVDKKPQVVIVASSVPGEGKTTVAVSLARLSARGGLKTLLIDGDLRRPSVGRVMRIPPATRGIVEVVSGAHPLDECVSKDPLSDVLVLTCAKKPASPSDLLSSHAMRQMIQNLRGVFDIIVIDSAPVLPVHDTKILSQLADTVLFVARWEKTPREGVVNALKALADVNAPVAGIVLARADMKRFQYYSYGYQNYYYYNSYYSG